MSKIVWSCISILLLAGDVKSVRLLPGIGDIAVGAAGMLTDDLDVSTLLSLVNPATATKECADAAKDCMHSAFGCKDRLMDCVFEALPGTADEPQFQDIGDIELQQTIARLASQAMMANPKTLEKHLLLRCVPYLPASMTRLLRSVVTAKSSFTKAEDFMCKVLTNGDVGVFMDETTAPEKCNLPSIINECNAQVEPLVATEVLGTYMAFLSGTPATDYVPGQGNVSKNLRKGSEVKPPVDLKQCLNAGDRLKCVAAMLLAETCEDSCTIARCAWNVMKNNVQCVSDNDRDTFFSTANEKCVRLAKAMGAEHPRCSRAQGLRTIVVIISVLFVLLFR